MSLARMMVIGGCSAAVIAASATGARAQSLPRRETAPPGGFAASAANSYRILALTTSAAAGYNAQVSDSDPLPSFDVEDLSAGLRYLARGSWFDFSAFGGSTAQRYSQLPSDFRASHTATFDGTMRLDRRTSVRTSVAGSLRPYYVLESFGGPAGLGQLSSMAPAIPRPNGAVFSGTADLTRTLSRRVTVTGMSEYRYSNFSGALLDTRSGSAGARLTFAAGRRTGLYAGYRYERGSFGSSGVRTLQIHHLDTGIDYRRALTADQRAFIGGSTGAAIVDDGMSRSVRLTGTLTFNKDIGRTWHADARYQRQVGFVLAFPGPTTADTLTLAAGGRWTRHLHVQTTAAYTTGSVGLTGPTRGFDMYTFTASVSRPINHLMSATLEGFYYHYSFAGSAVLPQGWPRQLDRPGIRAQMTVWLPLFERVRRRDAAR